MEKYGLEKSIVLRLEQLTMRKSCEEILSNLALCREHFPEEKKLTKTVAHSSYFSTSPLLASQELINFVRNRLHYFLVGTMNDKIRHINVEEFYSSLPDLGDNMVDPWAFLDCVLDDAFKELKTHASFPDSEPNLKLIPVIAKRSSQLQKLKIDFRFMKKDIGVEKVTPLIACLSSLHNLTSLNLCQLDKSHRSVLKFVGFSCPLLTNLKISGFCFSSKDIMSIVLGEFVDNLFTEIGRQISYEHLKAPVEVLTPICFNLRNLKLGDVPWDKESDNCWSATAFVLHHLSLLESMNGHATSFGVSYLDDSKTEKILTSSKIKEETEYFEKACSDYLASRSIPVSSLGKNLNYPEFSGCLSLTCLGLVYPNPTILSTIPKFCPNLKEVSFWDGLPSMPLLHPQVYEIISLPIDFENYLKEWPKLETIHFMDISPDYVKIILKSFAPSLKSVNFNTCENINLMDLLPCNQLESLAIFAPSSLVATKVDPSRLSPESLLPNLKYLESEICLDLWTLWLEPKSELTGIVLNCCHIGTKGSIHSDWNSIPQMWPKLELLDISRCATELTMSTVSSIVPRLTKLKDLSIPDITKNDPLAVKIWEDVNYHPVAPVRLCFFKGLNGGRRCSLLSEVNEEPMNSDYSAEESYDDEQDTSEDEDSENYMDLS